MENQSQSSQKRFKIMLSATDVSGDINGAWLCRALLKQNPKLEIFGFGGPMMRREGCDIGEKNLRLYGFRGIPFSSELWEKIIQQRTKKKEVYAIIDEMLNREPDVVVLLSSYFWNKKIAKRIYALNKKMIAKKEKPIPVIYCFLPDLWIYPFRVPDWWIFRIFWKKARNLFKYSSYLIANMRFEKDFYEKLMGKISFKEKAKVVYYGHPILDRVQEIKSSIKEEVPSEVNPMVKTIALLPGSRRDEVKNMLPIMIDAASKILEENKNKFSIKFLVSDAAAFLLEDIREILVRELKKIPNPKGKRPSITIEEGDKTPILVTLRKVDLVILASGTVALEVICLRKPMVVIYKLNLPTLLVYTLVILLRNFSFRVPIFSLANKIIEESRGIKTAKQKYFPEFFQFSLSKKIAKEALKLLDDKNWLKENEKNIKKAIEDQLGEGDASEKIVNFILNKAWESMGDKDKQRFSDDLKESISESISGYDQNELINKAKSLDMLILEKSDEGKNPIPPIQECLNYALEEKLIEKQDSEYIVPKEISDALEKKELEEVSKNLERLIKLSFAYLDKEEASFEEIIAELEIHLLDLIGLSTDFDRIADSLIKKETGKRQRPLKWKRHVLLIVLAVKIVSEAKKRNLIKLHGKRIFKLLEAK